MTRQQEGEEAIARAWAKAQSKPEEETTLPAYDCTEAERVEWKSHWARKLACRERQLLAALRERDALKDEVEKHKGRRVHTQGWYASHYGRLEDWARKVLPEPHRNQFFSCIANGTYDGMLDVGEPYMCKAGFMVTPSGYIHMDDAKGQLVIDQTRRAEDAEARVSTLKAQRDAVVGQETAEQAFERGQRVMRDYLASQFDSQMDFASSAGSLRHCLEFPYTPPLKSGTE